MIKLSRKKMYFSSSNIAKCDIHLQVSFGANQPLNYLN
jgi:hypothetical protein